MLLHYRIYHILISLINIEVFFLFPLHIQNWMSFGKIARDLVMRMQRIDSSNYPEVPRTLSHRKYFINFFLVHVSDRFFSPYSDITSNVHS